MPPSLLALLFEIGSSWLEVARMRDTALCTLDIDLVSRS